MDIQKLKIYSKKMLIFAWVQKIVTIRAINKSYTYIFVKQNNATNKLKDFLLTW